MTNTETPTFTNQTRTGLPARETTVVVTIGRNIGNRPMPADTWTCARRDLLQVIDRIRRTTVLGTANGTGEWDGVTEDNYSVTATVPLLQLGRLRQNLREVAWIYQQDAIGCVIHDHNAFGDSFVSRAPEPAPLTPQQIDDLTEGPAWWPVAHGGQA